MPQTFFVAVDDAAAVGAPQSESFVHGAPTFDTSASGLSLRVVVEAVHSVDVNPRALADRVHPRRARCPTSAGSSRPTFWSMNEWMNAMTWFAFRWMAEKFPVVMTSVFSAFRFGFS